MTTLRLETNIFFALGRITCEKIFPLLSSGASFSLFETGAFDWAAAAGFLFVYNLGQGCPGTICCIELIDGCTVLNIVVELELPVQIGLHRS